MERDGRSYGLYHKSPRFCINVRFLVVVVCEKLFMSVFIVEKLFLPAIPPLIYVLGGDRWFYLLGGFWWFGYVIFGYGLIGWFGWLFIWSGDYDHFYPLRILA